VARALDFFADPLPAADVISMGMILHDWNLAKKLHLIRAAYHALPVGGAFVAIEHLIDDARRENTFGLMMSLNMLIEFGDAFDFTGADFHGLVHAGRVPRDTRDPADTHRERGGRVQVDSREVEQDPPRRCSRYPRIASQVFLNLTRLLSDHLQRTTERYVAARSA